MDKHLFRVLKRKISLILSKYIDNKIWVLQEASEKLEILHFTNNKNHIIKDYKEDFLNQLAYEFPEKHKFILHIYSSYVYKLNNSIVEPTYGWIILSKYFVFHYSFPLIGDPWRPKPTLPSLLMFTLGSSKLIYLEDAISLRYGWENYYHFFLDTLGQIFILDQQGVPPHIPLLVPHYFNSISFVNEFLSLSSFIKRKIIIQGNDEFYHVKNLIVSKDVSISEGIKDVVLSLNYLRELHRNDKVFLYRPFVQGRSIINTAEIIKISKKYGFLAIDSSNLSLKEQISLFSGVSHLVGIHGAGLTNMVFRFGLSLSLMEIFPDKSLTPEHYRKLSNFFSFDYKYIIGENSDDKFNFYLDPIRFEMELMKF